MRRVRDFSGLDHRTILDGPGGIRQVLIRSHKLEPQAVIVRAPHELVARGGSTHARTERAAPENRLLRLVGALALTRRREDSAASLDQRRRGGAQHALLIAERLPRRHMDRHLAIPDETQTGPPAHVADPILHDKPLAARLEADVALVDRVGDVELESAQGGQQSAIRRAGHVVDLLVEDDDIVLLRRRFRDLRAVRAIKAPVVRAPPVVAEVVLLTATGRIVCHARRAQSAHHQRRADRRNARHPNAPHSVTC